MNPNSTRLTIVLRDTKCHLLRNDAPQVARPVRLFRGTPSFIPKEKPQKIAPSEVLADFSSAKIVTREVQSRSSAINIPNPLILSTEKSLQEEIFRNIWFNNNVPMATTISRQPRATSVRCASASASPVLGPSYDDYVVQRMKERFGNTPEQIRERENTGRDRYNAFLSDMGEDPEMIGNARLTGTSRNRGLSVPTIDQEFDAVALNDQFNADAGRLRIAANDARRAGRSDLWADIQNRLSAMEGQRGAGRSNEFRRDYWRDRLAGASDYRTANGFY